jgi:hypothetical protein
MTKKKPLTPPTKGEWWLLGIIGVVSILVLIAAIQPGGVQNELEMLAEDVVVVEPIKEVSQNEFADNSSQDLSSALAELISGSAVFVVLGGVLLPIISVFLRAFLNGDKK